MKSGWEHHINSTLKDLLREGFFKDIYKEGAVIRVGSVEIRDNGFRE